MPSSHYAKPGLFPGLPKDTQYRHCTFGVPALPVLAHRHPGEFERFSMLHGDRPSCVRVVQLADLTLFLLNWEEQARRFPGTP